MEQVYCCKDHINHFINLVMYGQRILLDTNLPRGNQTRLCQYKLNNYSCENRAFYYITLTARYEAPPLPEAVERVLEKNVEIQARFLKDVPEFSNGRE